jgi:SET domain-containing protein
MVDFEIKKTKDRGQGLFAKRDFDKGAIILHFGGGTITREEIIANNISNEVSDRYLQIGTDLFLVIKDHSQFLNHSCNPNSYIRIAVNNAFLVAAKPIKKDTELTFDYSLTDNSELHQWAMNCSCGAYACRKTISGFQHLTQEHKDKLIAKGVVPKYNLPKE